MSTQSVEPDIPESVFDDQWGGSGGSWTLNSTECVGPAVLMAATSVSGLEVKGGSTPENSSCLYANSADDYAIGYYYFPASIATLEPGPATVQEAASLGSGARTLPQTALKPEGCIVTVPMTGVQDYFLGLTANSASKSVDEMCVEAVAYVRVIATQGPYVEPPTCDLLDPRTDGFGPEFMDRFATITDTYFGGDGDAAYWWAAEECDVLWPE